MKKRLTYIIVSSLILVGVVVFLRIYMTGKESDEQIQENISVNATSTDASLEDTTMSPEEEYEQLQQVAGEDYELVETDGNIYPYDSYVKYGGVGYKFGEIKYIPSVDDIPELIPDYKETRQCMDNESLCMHNTRLWYFEVELINDSTSAITACMGNVCIAITDTDGGIIFEGSEPFYVECDEENEGTKSAYMVTLQAGERKNIILGLYLDGYAYEAGLYTEDDELDYYIKISGIMTDGNMYEHISEDNSHIYLKFYSGRMSDFEE